MSLVPLALLALIYKYVKVRPFMFLEPKPRLTSHGGKDGADKDWA